MYSNKQRIVAVAICMVIICVTCFSILFIVRQADHDCTGHECPICVHIRDAKQSIHRIGFGVVNVVVAAFILLICYASSYMSLIDLSARNTLIRQKVRMNN